jgi:monovalent cation:H+ antiporter-2, CPA2 family
MAAAIDPAAFKETLIVLGAASVVIPVFHRLKLSPLLGFILVGVLVGPFGLGALSAQAPWLSFVTITEPKSIALVAELGIVFLLFMIGLELSFERLKMMRRLVFGLGPLQMLTCTAAIAAAGLAFGLNANVALVMGLALAVSSTAMIVQVLADAKKLTAPVGRASFGVLLFQDLAVAPILFAVAVLGQSESGAGLGAFGLAMGQAALAIIAIVLAGRLLLRPLFRQVARTQSPELFMAACLLVIVVAGLAAAGAGLSMALGALIAGVLLAETEYRRQIEVLIEPFKGLLLGVFLISVGMSINAARIVAEPALILGGAFALIVVKGALIYGLIRAFNLKHAVAARSALLLAPGSEFTFVILGSAAALGVLPAPVSEIGLLIAAITMALIPLFWTLSARLEPARTAVAAADAPSAPQQDAAAPSVVIVGFGRVGRVIADLLEAHQIAYLAIDSNADVVAAARKAGRPVYFGNVQQPAFLKNCKVDVARALVVTMDAQKITAEVVKAARDLSPDLIIVARARDAAHAATLYRLGATDAVPETVESSLQLGETVLVDVGVPMGHAIASIHDLRAAFRKEIQALAPNSEIRARRRVVVVPKGQE